MDPRAGVDGFGKSRLHRDSLSGPSGVHAKILIWIFNKQGMMVRAGFI